MSTPRTRAWAALLALTLLLPGCAVIAVADAAASMAVGAAGLAVDAAVGTVRVGGKLVGAAVDAVTDDEDDDQETPR